MNVDKRLRFCCTRATSPPPEGGGLKWNEENIKATFHPIDKDYGLMKVEEPKTPYSYDMSHDQGPVSAQVLAERIEAARLEVPKAIKIKREDEGLTPVEKERQSQFEKKRKMHYNEFQAVKAMRERMAKSEDEDEDEDTEATTVKDAKATAVKSSEQGSKASHRSASSSEQAKK